MSTVKLIAALFLGIVLLFAVGAEGYFYFYSQKQNSSADEVAKSIQNALKPKPFSEALADARTDLQTQTERLDEMQASFPDSPSLDAAIKADVSKAAAEAAKDDALVADPKLDLSSQPKIVALGQEATEALAYLQTLIAHNASTVVLNDAALNAVDLVDAYSKEIADYVDSSDSGDPSLPSDEQAAYQAQAKEIVAEVDSVEDSLGQIDSVPAGDQGSNDGGQNPSDISGQAPSNGSGSDGSGNDGSGSSSQGGGADSGGQGSSGQNGGTAGSSDQGQGSGQSSNQNNSQNSDQSGTAPVTLEDIVNQQQAVDQTSAEVEQLEEQTAQNNSPAPSPSDSSNGTPSGYSDDGSNPSSQDNGGDDAGSDTSGGSDQTSSATGTVRLIQAENNF